MLLKTINLPHNDLAYTNALFHSKQDFPYDQTYLEICNCVYKSDAHIKIEKGYIGMNQILRRKYNLSINELVPVQQKNSCNEQISKIYFVVSQQFKKNLFNTIHEDELRDTILKTLKNHYFHKNQFLILRYTESTLILEIIAMEPEKGFSNNNTQMLFVTNDLDFKIISKQLLKRELFQEEYNFETIGIGGLNHKLVSIFRRALSSRAFSPKLLEKLGTKHVKGMLLYGPPGTGKTLIARNIGKLLTNRPPKVINGPEVLNKYVGQSEENIRNIFSDARMDYEQNGENSDLHVIIFDEIDAICRKRGYSGVNSSVTDSLVNQLLTQIEGMQQLNNIFIIAMTNRRDLIDPALLRAGRIELHVEIGLPDRVGRRQILNIHTQKMQHNQIISKDVDLDLLADITINFTGAEIESLVKNAASFALHELLTSKTSNVEEDSIKIEMSHFLKAKEEIIPSFGFKSMNFQKLIPEKFLFPTKSHSEIFEEILNSLAIERVRNSSFLIFGRNGSGKTSLLAKLALDSKIDFIRFIRPIDITAMEESQRVYFLLEMIDDALLTNKSLIIFDDLEILINYANIDNQIIFSNKLYQCLITILKTPLKNVTIVGSTSDEKFGDIMRKSFDKYHIFNYFDE